MAVALFLRASAGSPTKSHVCLHKLGNCFVATTAPNFPVLLASNRKSAHVREISLIISLTLESCRLRLKELPMLALRTQQCRVSSKFGVSSDISRFRNQ